MGVRVARDVAGTIAWQRRGRADIAPATAFFAPNQRALAVANPVTPAAWNSQFLTGNNTAAYFDDLSIYSDGDRGKVVRCRLDANAINGNPSGNHGTVLYPILTQQPEAAWIEYDLRFSNRLDGNPFEWGWGGKLPGLMGVAAGTDLATPSGGNGSSDLAWAGRLMWLSNPPYPGNVPSDITAKVIPYMYHPGQAGAYGDNVWSTPPHAIPAANTWHRVRVEYRLNTVRSVGDYDNDGVLRFLWDGNQVVKLTNYRFRTRPDVKITHTSFACFRGGGTLDWATSNDNYIDFDNIRVGLL